MRQKRWDEGTGVNGEGGMGYAIERWHSFNIQIPQGTKSLYTFKHTGTYFLSKFTFPERTFLQK